METVAVVFGGRSPEHDVSIITAHVPIIETLLSSKEFDVWPVYISKDGHWYADKRMNELTFFKDPRYEQEVKRWKPVELSLEGGLALVMPGWKRTNIKIDIVFPAMHGSFGEDGSLMGLLRMANVPFVGCDLFASAVAMDKVLTKQVVAAEGMPIVPYVWFTRAQWEKDADSIRARIAKLKRPLFVKPVHLGSSIGITKAKSDRELEQAIEVALHYDDKVLVEESVENLIEITLPLMGNDDIRPALPERPLNKTEFFDFNDKYLGGSKGSGVNSAYSEVPAQIGEELSQKIIDLGTKVYSTLGCSGIARVDFLINADTKEVFVNEVNTLPGSLYHHNWKKAGVSNKDLVLGLLKLGRERFASQKTTTFTFGSSILQKVGGPKTQ